MSADVAPKCGSHYCHVNACGTISATSINAGATCWDHMPRQHTWAPHMGPNFLCQQLWDPHVWTKFSMSAVMAYKCNLRICGPNLVGPHATSANVDPTCESH